MRLALPVALHLALGRGAGCSPLNFAYVYWAISDDVPSGHRATMLSVGFGCLLGISMQAQCSHGTVFLEPFGRRIAKVFSSSQLYTYSTTAFVGSLVALEALPLGAPSTLALALFALACFCSSVAVTNGSSSDSTSSPSLCSSSPPSSPSSSSSPSAPASPSCLTHATGFCLFTSFFTLFIMEFTTL